MWDHISTNAKNIQKAPRTFGWKKAFENFSVDKKVDPLISRRFSETVFKIQKLDLTIVSMDERKYKKILKRKI